MKLSDYQKETKPLSLRIISVSIIVSFLVTQLDVKLAFSSPAILPTPLASSADKQDIHYMQDLDGFLRGEGDSPLKKSEAEKSKKPEEVQRELEDQVKEKEAEKDGLISN